jgi:hypothetical protein
MFDVTPEDIAQLNDVDLRELIGRLCEAELASRGLSPAAVTWGGSQTAADGGLDVRVSLPRGTVIEGFVPRASTGFQVKTPDMAHAAINKEMRPKGAVRSVIEELAGEGGAYIIVSSHGSTADRPLRDRKQAMREALDGAANAELLATDFYDRTRLATWVRCHPGLVVWVKAKVGRALSGWQPYGPWSNSAEDIDAEYLLDEHLRLRLGEYRDQSERSIAQAIDLLRDQLAPPREIVRLIGLSGVGKTRFVQALFDSRIGERPLQPSLAVYTNLSDDPSPQPISLVSDLIANRRPAIVIVDNCPPDLHSRLSAVCAAADSTVSVLTVEYDVREDQPERTQVVVLDTSSIELIEKLIQRRFPNVSEVDARTIAEACGGNARIAIALAGTVEHSGTVSGLSDRQLFERLFRQRHDQDHGLLTAARVCALVYSFDGETLSGETTEIARLGALAGQLPANLYRNISELMRRDLVQKRAVWRAILPHALANVLAAQALEEIPYEWIHEQFLTDGGERLARSFSRRLSFLHDRPEAWAIANRWLAPDGLLGDVSALNALGQAMFENVCPVVPDAALANLERAVIADPSVTIAMTWRRLPTILRSIAYDASFFERTAQLFISLATQCSDQQGGKDAADTFLSLFTLYLSGTHATIQQRLSVIAHLIRSGDTSRIDLGLAALDNILETTHFSSHHSFQFGARSRDYGHNPESDRDVTVWYRSALEEIGRMVNISAQLRLKLGEVVAKNFRGLWTSVPIWEELEGLALTFSRNNFWNEGWVACRQTIRFDMHDLDSEVAARLVSLEGRLRPQDLASRVRGMVLGVASIGSDLSDVDSEESIESQIGRLNRQSRELGAAVAVDGAVFEEILPDLFAGGTKPFEFGGGLASVAEARAGIWMALVAQFRRTPIESRDLRLLKGFLAETWNEDCDLAHSFFDDIANDSAVVTVLPFLHFPGQLDERSLGRLKRVLLEGIVPVGMYVSLGAGLTNDLPEEDFIDLLTLIDAQRDGFDVAVVILHMHFFSDQSAGREPSRELLDVGKVLLRKVQFNSINSQQEYHLSGLINSCLGDAQGAAVATEIIERLKIAVAAHEALPFENRELLSSLIKIQPIAVLDKLFAVVDPERGAFLSALTPRHIQRTNVMDRVPIDLLIGWANRDAGGRYPIIAAIISFSVQSGDDTDSVWSDQAKALLINAPRPEDVLDIFVARFPPTAWTGSLAAVMETNGRLLDRIEADFPPSLIQIFSTAKERFADRVARERQSETERDRVRDERFE